MIKVAVTKPGAVTEERETRIGEQDIFMTGSEFIHLNSGENEVKIELSFFEFSSSTHSTGSVERCLQAGDRLYIRKVGFVVTLQD